jgi:hypothetical protein
MTKKKVWLIFVMVGCTLVSGAIACGFPAKLGIEDGKVLSALGDGYATLNLTNAGCDCETGLVTGKLEYTDGQGPDKVLFTAKIDHELGSGCLPEDNTKAWTSGTYTYQGKKGIFHVGLFGPDDMNYDEDNCAGCELCWRLWLVGGKHDGYQNWACTLEYEDDALTYELHPAGSGCE